MNFAHSLLPILGVWIEGVKLMTI